MVVGVVAGLVLLVVLIVYAVVGGTTAIPLERVAAALHGRGTPFDQLVIVDRRLGRAVGAALVGFLLGVSGGLTQTITRNPIATPDILGVTAGSGLFAVLAITGGDLFGGVEHGAMQVAPAALMGATVTTLAVLILSWRGGFDGFRLVLVGLGVNAMALAGTSWALSRASVDAAAIAVRWLIGSLDGIRLTDALMLVPPAVLALGASILLSRDLTSLRLGREVAVGLGTPTGRVEIGALSVAVVVVASATAVAGPIGFVAFLAPQLALRVFRTAGPPPVAGGLTGAVFLLAVDTVCQALPTPLPVGALTALLGAPALLFLLLHHRRGAHV